MITDQSWQRMVAASDNLLKNPANLMVKPICTYAIKSRLFCLLLCFTATAWAETPNKQQQLNRDIKTLSSEIDQQKKESSSLGTEVSSMEKKLGEISRQQHDTEKKIEGTLARLEETNQRKLKLDDELNTQRSGLAQQLQAMYTAGEQSHLRLLLRQDNPSDISRTLRYFEYMNTHRTAKISAINDTLGKIKALTSTMEQDRLKLSGLEETLSAQKKTIQGTLSARAAALNKLQGDVRSKESQLSQLRKEEANLQATIDRLAARAAQKEKLKVAAAQKAAAEKAAQAKAAQAQVAAAASANNKAAQRTPATPAPAAKPVAATVARPEIASFTPNKPFSTLKGKLAPPVTGQIIHAYGSSRNEKQRWRGVVIAAPGGSKVRAVARGRVVFSGWMDGYGHLLIIEHDQNYLSLYGYNRAVYKREGQLVNANDVIAAVGNSSGQSQDGLYFEIRRKTEPQNPAQWLR